MIEQPTVVRLGDGQRAVLITAAEAAPLAAILRRFALPYLRESGSRAGEAIYALRDVLESVLREDEADIRALAELVAISLERSSLDLEAEHRAPSEPMVTTGRAAKYLGRSRRTVQLRAAAGGFPGARREGRMWLIPVAALTQTAAGGSGP